MIVFVCFICFFDESVFVVGVGFGIIGFGKNVVMILLFWFLLVLVYVVIMRGFFIFVIVVVGKMG